MSTQPTSVENPGAKSVGPLIAGADVGTMNYQFVLTSLPKDAKTRPKEIKSVRTVFVKIPKWGYEIAKEQDAFSYIENGDDLFLLGKSVHRRGPLRQRKRLTKGYGSKVYLNIDDDDAQLVVKTLIRDSIGYAPDENSVAACSCHSSPEAGQETEDLLVNTAHKTMLRETFAELGWRNVEPIPEGQAVVFAENPIARAGERQFNYTGVGVSFGAGLSQSRSDIPGESPD